MAKLRSYTNIQLDFGMTRHRVTIEARQGDRNTRYVRACTLCHGAQLTLEGLTARAEYKQANGRGAIVDCEVDEAGYIILELTDLMLSVPGLMAVTLVLYQGGAFLTSQEFDVKVRPRLVGEETVAPDVPGMSTAEALAKLDTLTKELLADFTEQVEEVLQDAGAVLGNEVDRLCVRDVTGGVDYTARFKLVNGKPVIEYEQKEELINV